MIFNKGCLLAENSRRTDFLIFLIVLTGLAFRLFELDKRGMTHIEIYVPGIELPAGLTNPSPRLTIPALLRSMIGSEEPHPPGYYLLMFGWTKITGTDLWWLRLPSVIFGTACILLIFLIARQEKAVYPGLIAALLISLNGHQVFWSQLAKNYIVAESVGLAATLMLLLANRGGKRERFFQLIYLVLVLSGISLTVYFWPILLVHMLWTLLEKWKDRRFPGIFQVQYLALILGSPLISLAVFQSRRASYLGENFLPSVSQFLGFGYTLEGIPPGFEASLWIKFIPSFLLIVGIIFLAAGIWSSRQDRDKSQTLGISKWILFSVTPFATVLILIFGAVVWPYFPEAARNALMVAVLPSVLLGAFLVLKYLWGKKTSGISSVDNELSTPLSNLKLSAYLAVIPVLLIALATPVVAIFASRGILLYTPYLLLVLSYGAWVLVKRSRWWIPVLLVVILIQPVGGVLFRNKYTSHPTDYKFLSEKWIPEIQDGDLIFIQRHWVTTPIYYYLDAKKYWVVSDLQPEIMSGSLSGKEIDRIWVLTTPGVQPNESQKQVLEVFRQVKSIDARNISVLLFIK
ncbi:MAG: hypothetical protein A2Z16_03335 [Chloroflexi bacterium RBG_16_54_18]|nr:MAG: hypothetical protein A2Z16_03335 [Chloroflexi bacterium RBG_16_54_18]